MATKNLVPRATGEGQIGTSSKKWSRANFVSGSFDNLLVNGQAVSGGGSPDSISEGDSSVEVTDTGSNGTITFKTDNTNKWRIESNGDLIPQTSGIDIGSPTNPVNSLYISNNSIHFSNADNTATPYVLSIDTSNNKLRFSSDDGVSFEEIVKKDSSGSLDVSVTATPTNDTDVVNKAYVDSVAQGLDVKESVRLATTSVLPNSPSYSNGVITSTSYPGSSGLQIDSRTVSVNDRILVKNGDSIPGSRAHNGIYTVTATGGSSTHWTLTRASDANSSDKLNPGMFTFVEDGQTNANLGFVLSNTGSITLNSTELYFSQFSGAGQITAGTGLGKSGNSLSLNFGNLSSPGTRTINDYIVTRQNPGGLYQQISLKQGIEIAFSTNSSYGLAEETSIADDDQLIIYDASASAAKRMSKSDFVSGLGSGGGGGSRPEVSIRTLNGGTGFTIGDSTGDTDLGAISSSETERVYIINATSTSSTSTITLPSIAHPHSLEGFKIQIKRVGAGVVKIYTGSTSRYIDDGSTTQKDLDIQYSSLTLVAPPSSSSNNTWYII